MDAVARANELERAGRLEEARAAWLRILDVDPRNAAALHRLGVLASRMGRMGEALSMLQKSLAIREDPEAFLDFGAALGAMGRWDAALAAYGAACRLAPSSIDARYGLGLAHHNLGRPREAEEHYRAVLAKQPNLGAVHGNLGHALQAQDRLPEALQAYREAVRVAPRNTGCWNGLGNVLVRLGRAAEAEAAYRESIGLNAAQTEAWHNLAWLRLGEGQPSGALHAARRAAAIEPADARTWQALGAGAAGMARRDVAVRAGIRAVRLAPSDPGARDGLAKLLWDGGRAQEAMAQHRAGIALRPDFPEALLNRARALHALKDGGALEVLRRLLSRHPMSVEAWRTVAQIRLESFRPAEGAEACRRAVAIAPGNPRHYLDLGVAAGHAGRHAQAADAYGRAFRLDPADGSAVAQLLHHQRHACDWRDLEIREALLLKRLRGQARTGDAAEPLPPFGLLALDTTPADQRAAAERWARLKARGVVPLSPLARVPAAPADGRIRIGYLSANFHEHAVANLIAELLELHDRGRFAVTAYSTGMDDGSPMRRRLASAVERFVDLRGRSDAEAARLIAADGTGILVDLMGYTAFARTPILAARPAPVQVNWLGYPGTMAADFIDYILADPVVIPPGEEAHYGEAVVRLPHCYQPNDRSRAVGATPTRAECGLPEQGFVFCCFNSPYKIGPAMFDLWGRLLRAVPGSVLWLFAGNAAAEANLRREAALRGIAPERLVFAPPLPLAGHLARHRLADLFLDTLPYNAHTTASDALWAGLPVLTCRGRSFAGRVAASLLGAAGLPELVTESLEDYEVAALSLARDPARLRALAGRLAAARTSCPLFDTPGFARHIEAAYQAMWDLHRAGAAPRPITVPAG
ncbi:tetratricopeptide repeat protein [Azospirillum sp. SYSU D00513]|uniref:tetratricopeptide repeat protein n=1 Tax=Azospirillum sp. SYSU D00513 TaxID=2812561 RepID=UPI001A96FB3D|nr:tetratricopeptide repeat protein [Azospirillum sp. SYSU D00513]